tara:strand:+ start:4140 stop:4394 length:255 start_codon:yes stop_codon:yes gene_type:complete
MPKKQCQTMTKKNMRRFATKLRREASRLDAVAEALDRNHLEDVDLYYTDGANRAMKQLDTFISNAHKTISEMDLPNNGTIENQD